MFVSNTKRITDPYDEIKKLKIQTKFQRKMQKFNDLVARTDMPVFNSENQNSVFETSRNIKLEGSSTSVHQEILSDDEENPK